MAWYFRYKLGDDIIKFINYLFFFLLVIVVGWYVNKEVKYDDVNKVVKSVNIVEENTIRSAIEKVYDAVYVIESYSIDGGSSIGSGFAYKIDTKYGYILTNYHVVKDSDSITIIDNKGEEFTAKLLGYDELMDLAVLATDKDTITLVASLSSTSINIGDTVFTVGSPEGTQYKGTVTKGIVSGLNREVKMNLGNEEYIMNVMQTDAAINPGNSGGPLVNINGEVIGINSLKIVQNEIEGMGFAIPIEEVMLYTDRLEQGKEIKRPYIGLELKNTMSGIVVSNIKMDAVKSDLSINDVIVSVDDVVVKDVIHFRYLLYKHSIGDQIKIKYIRDNKECTTNILLTK